MARRTGGVTKRRGSSPEYGQGSAKQYQQQTRERLRNQAMRAWVIRLAILAVLAFAGWMWGGSVLSAITQKGREAKYELQKSQQGVKAANDERSGAGFNPDE